MSDIDDIDELLDYAEALDEKGSWSDDSVIGKAKEPIKVHLKNDVAKDNIPEKNKSIKAKRDDVLFADEDLLDDLGSGEDASKPSVPKEEKDVLKARQLTKELFSDESTISFLNPNATSIADSSRGFVLDKKYQKMEKPEREEDFSFGEYKPSSSHSSNGPRNRRIHNTNEDDDDTLKYSATPTEVLDLEVRSNSATMQSSQRVMGSSSSKKKETSKILEDLCAYEKDDTVDNTIKLSNDSWLELKDDSLHDESISEKHLITTKFGAKNKKKDDFISELFSDSKKEETLANSLNKEETISFDDGNDEDWRVLSGFQASRESLLDDRPATGAAKKLPIAKSKKQKLLQYLESKNETKASENSDWFMNCSQKNLKSQKEQGDGNINSRRESRASLIRANSMADEILDDERRNSLMSRAPRNLKKSISSEDNFELRNLVKELEMSVHHTEQMLADQTRQHHEQLQVLQTRHQKQMELMSEMERQRETQLKENHENMLEALKEKNKRLQADLLEQEAENRELLVTTRASYQKHMQALEEQHVEALRALQENKKKQIEALNTPVEGLETLLSKVSSSSDDLGEMQRALQAAQHEWNAQRETEQAVIQGKILRLETALEEERSLIQLERSRLSGQIASLQEQLALANQRNEEERWKLKDDCARLSAMEKGIEQERARLRESQAREQFSHAEERERMRNEQQALLRDLHEERRLLAEERTAFQIQVKMHSEQTQRQGFKEMRSSADLEGNLKVVEVEKLQLRTMTEDVAREKFELEQQKIKLKMIEGDQAREQALTKQREVHVNKLYQEGLSAQRTSESKLADAQRIESMHQTRLEGIQRQMEELKKQQQSLDEENLRLMESTKDLETAMTEQVCISCRLPLSHDKKVQALADTLTSMQPQFVQTRAMQNTIELSNSSKNLRNSMQEALQSMEMDHMIRKWSLHAKKDHEYLEDQANYLDNIQRSSTFSSGIFDSNSS